jgi:hypothetical protein
MDLARGVSKDFVSRREALAMLGAVAAVRSAGAAEQAITQPVSLDHVNVRVSSVAKTAEFYMGLFDMRRSGPSRHRRPAKDTLSSSATAISPYRRRSPPSGRISITIPSGFVITRKRSWRRNCKRAASRCRRDHPAISGSVTSTGR